MIFQRAEVRIQRGSQLYQEHQNALERNEDVACAEDAPVFPGNLGFNPFRFENPQTG